MIKTGSLKFLAVILICLLLAGCPLTSPKFFIPLGYAAIGLGIAVLVTPSWVAAVSGFMLGAAIGAAIYNNSLKPDLVDRLALPSSSLTESKQ